VVACSTWTPRPNHRDMTGTLHFHPRQDVHESRASQRQRPGGRYSHSASSKLILLTLLTLHVACDHAKIHSVICIYTYTHTHVCVCYIHTCYTYNAQKLRNYKYMALSSARRTKSIFRVSSRRNSLFLCTGQTKSIFPLCGGR
jgi:hypothetical protein